MSAHGLKNEANFESHIGVNFVDREPQTRSRPFMQPRTGGDLTTHEDLEMDETSLQMVEQMEMVPIGKIEEVTK